MIDRPYRTAAEVARELGVSLRTVRRWIADGRLPAIRVGRAVRIPLDAYGEVPVGSGAPAARGGPDAARRLGEVAASYSAGATAPTWPDTPARLVEQRRNAAALMDRLAAPGRPAAGPTDTGEALLDLVRDEFGATGAPVPPSGENSGTSAAAPAQRRSTR